MFFFFIYFPFREYLLNLLINLKVTEVIDEYDNRLVLEEVSGYLFDGWVKISYTEKDIFQLRLPKVTASCRSTNHPHRQCPERYTPLM